MGIFSNFRLTRRVSELEEEVSKLKRIVEDHDLDWSDMRARCKRLLDRTEKAANRLQEGETEIDSELPIPLNNGEGMAGLVHHALTPRQRAIQSQILHRRLGGR
jgi:hypothetical protein